MAPGVESARKKYACALRLGRMTLRRDGDAQDQVEQFSQALALEEDVRFRTREILNLMGVARIDRVAYFNFSRRIAKLVRKYQSRTLENETRNAIAQWLLAGAKHEVLLTILREVFTLGVK